MKKANQRFKKLAAFLMLRNIWLYFFPSFRRRCRRIIIQIRQLEILQKLYDPASFDYEIKRNELIGELLRLAIAKGRRKKIALVMERTSDSTIFKIAKKAFDVSEFMTTTPAITI